MAKVNLVIIRFNGRVQSQQGLDNYLGEFVSFTIVVFSENG